MSEVRDDKSARPGKAFDAWLASLPDSTRSLRLSERDDFDNWLGGLTEAAAAAAGALRPDAGAANAEARYCAVVMESGEYPVVKVYKTAEGLVRAVGRLVGQDVCVACFRGSFLPITVGPERFLLVGDTAISFPLLPGAPIRRLPSAQVLAGSEVQEDSFLGPAELAQPERRE